jgi:hypothetical protein
MMRTTVRQSAMRSRPKTANLAYSLIEAAHREEASLRPSEEWSGIVCVSGETFRLPKRVDIEDVEYLHSLEWSRNDDLVHIMLERSAFRLGYGYSNPKQRFVRSRKGGVA